MDKSAREQLARYRQLRTTQRELNRTLTRMLPDDAIRECGTRLGVYRDDALVFGSESEVSVLMDYCVYDYRRDGQNVIERYTSETAIPGDPDKSSVRMPC
jgi:hypothetical protein